MRTHEYFHNQGRKRRSYMQFSERFFSFGWAAAFMVLGCVLSGCPEDPGPSPEQPLIRWGDGSTTTSGERGNVMINEINFAGSVTDDGHHDPDDIFIELLNKHPRPANISGWRLNIRGDYQRSYRIPEHTQSIPPNGYFVIAKKRDGAFGDVADMFIEDLQLGRKKVWIELRDFDQRLIEPAGHRDMRVFAGGYDLVSVRSMERASIIFGNSGTNARNWHSYSDDEGFPTIREGYRKFTLASPGASNSADYSGSTTSGAFE